MKMLLAVDGSDGARLAVEFVANAGWLHPGNEVTVFTAIPPPDAQARRWDDPDLVQADERIDAGSVLEPVRRRLAATGMTVRCDWAEGVAPDAIVRMATQGCFDLVVMGCRGRGALASLVLGSSTSGVLAGCRMPLLAIR